jgi:hypothetical protein
MKHDNSAPDAALRQVAPADVFYVVESTGVLGAREHRVQSALFESRLHAEAQLRRLNDANSGGSYGIWKGTTYLEPAAWSRDVRLSNGSVIVARPFSADDAG